MGDADWTLLGLDDGTVFHGHGAGRCAGMWCCLHNPSAHPLATAPLRWRPDLYLMERRCPHEQHHPDPDSLEYLRNLPVLGGPAVALIAGWHHCDGCCGGVGHWVS